MFVAVSSILNKPVPNPVKSAEAKRIFILSDLHLRQDTDLRAVKAGHCADDVLSGIFFIMNNGLKFRAWDHLMRGFSYFDLRCAHGHLPSDIPDHQIQQCTGLVDSKGFDVYEGDIVEFDNSDWEMQAVIGVGEVVFCRDLLVVESPQYGILFKDGFCPGMRGRLEVKGNIFENAPLISGSWGAGEGAS